MQELLKKFDKLKVLVLGDVMIDSYVWGKVHRISPEAPVPVVNVQKRERRLGGAANVALNLQALGAQPILCSLVGKDEEGGEFAKLLEVGGMSSEGIMASRNRPTTVKHRILAGSQQLLRIDTETDRLLNAPEAEMLEEKVRQLLPQVDVVIFEDYDKGVLGEHIIDFTIQEANRLGIPTAVDPKKRNFLQYAGVTLFKPNLKELKEGLKVDFEGYDQKAVEAALFALKEKMPIKKAMVTLSEDGVLITDFSETVHLSAHKREIADVSGAGDTVISIAALCLAAGATNRQLAFLSNLGGGLVCEHLGVVPIQKGKLTEEALRLWKAT